ncbi:hypothetical protein NC652_022380 [Populus alba x Populus x berolinensis]|nr:hypothetical protein NC652_022380 [Populus alba x Populus x berolinensis]
MGCVFGKELNAKKCAVEREGGGGERRTEVEVRVAKAEENEVAAGCLPGSLLLLVKLSMAGPLVALIPLKNLIRLGKGHIVCVQSQGYIDGENCCIEEGLVTSRMSCSLYLVFEYMEHDLAGLAASPNIKFTEPQPMTSRVVTLWYRPQSFFLGPLIMALVWTWSAGCILAELLAGKPIMPGRTERCIAETFKDFPPSSLPLIETLLAIDPAERRTATAALRSEFFTTKPYACDPSVFQNILSKEMDANYVMKKVEEAPFNNSCNAKSKSEKFPPPHQDGTLGYPLGSSHHIDPVLIHLMFQYHKFLIFKSTHPDLVRAMVDPAAVGAPKERNTDKNAAQVRERRHVI